MCGIAGIFRRRGGAPDLAVLDAMTDRLQHRGPDGRGTYVHDGVGFGHRRLSIIGLSDGQQPMTNEDRTIWVTYNGEIYNHLALKAELEALGHRFVTHSDTEVLVHGYEAWGPKLAERLRGIFAFAIHDQVRRRVLLCRDHLGVKPLYYHLSPGLLLFGSEPKAVLAHPEMPKRPDLSAVALYLRYGYVPAPHSAFEGLRQLEPGCRLLVDAAEDHVERYWWPGPIGSGRVRDVDEALDARIDETVRLELMSEVPLGAFLSGGVDSSIVAAAMARAPQLEARPRTFCIGFPEPDFDESPHSRRVAEHLELDHTVETISIDELDVLDTLVRTYDEPFADASAIPTYALCRMARRHVTVALSGDGGDEVFAGYRRYAKLAAYPQLPGFARKLAGRAADLYPTMVRGQRRLRLYGSPMATQYELDLSLFADDLLARVAAPELCGPPVWTLAEHFERAPCEDPIARAQWCDLVTYLPNDILAKVDRASMAHALEVRVPLLDHEFVSWSLGLPMSETFADGEGKRALKRHLSRRVPRSIFERPKMGFGVPLDYWLGGEGLGGIARRLEARVPGGGFLAPLRRDAIDQLTASDGAIEAGERVWSLLFLEAWFQAHFL
jgi:asparagine synthase (glutamine-hydrolysing)